MCQLFLQLLVICYPICCQLSEYIYYFKVGANYAGIFARYPGIDKFHFL